MCLISWPSTVQPGMTTKRCPPIIPEFTTRADSTGTDAVESGAMRTPCPLPSSAGSPWFYAPVSGMQAGACLAGADWVALLVPTTASGELWLGCPGRASWWGHRSPFRQSFNGVALLGRGRPCGLPCADGRAVAGQG